MKKEKDQKQTPLRSVGDWHAYASDQGPEYYYNSATGECVWEPPIAEIAPNYSAAPVSNIDLRLTYNPYNPEVPHPLAKCGHWVLYLDPTTQQQYYFNEETQVSSWTCPTDWADDLSVVPPLTYLQGWEVYRDPFSFVQYFVWRGVEGGESELPEGHTQWEVPAEIADQVIPEATGEAIPENHAARVGGWDILQDPESGHYYYYNRDTGVTQWEAPEEVKEADAVEWEAGASAAIATGQDQE
ncbi:unnamed protein product, partial [Symbiodinium sp. KB8]